MPEPSASGSTVIAGLRYRDANAAMDFLQRAFGFVRHAVYPGKDNTVQHAELRHGNGMVMLGTVRDEGPHAAHVALPSELGDRVTSGLYIIVPDCNPVWERVKAANARVVMELQTMDYGGQSFSVLDPEGYLWSFGEYDPWKAYEAASGPKSASDRA